MSVTDILKLLFVNEFEHASLFTQDHTKIAQKVLQIQIYNKTIIEFGSRRI